MKSSISILMAVSKKEFTDHIRNGWIVAVGIAFAVFALLITFAGFGFTGNVGVLQEQSSMFSLINLVIYLAPLLGLLLSYDGIAGEHENGTLNLLRSYPFRTLLLLYGKWMGLSLVLMATLFVGMVFPSSIAIYQGHSLFSWVILFCTSAWIGIVFNAIALMFSTIVLERRKLIAISIGIWLLFVVLFDLAVIGLIVLTEGDVAVDVVNLLFYLNPTSLYRLISIELIMDSSMIEQLGLAGQIPSLAMLMGSMLLWTVLPIMIASWRLRNLNS